MLTKDGWFAGGGEEWRDGGTQRKFLIGVQKCCFVSVGVNMEVVCIWRIRRCGRDVAEVYLRNQTLAREF
jgi:hypothetical protein